MEGREKGRGGDAANNSCRVYAFRSQCHKMTINTYLWFILSKRCNMLWQLPMHESKLHIFSIKQLPVNLLPYFLFWLKEGGGGLVFFVFNMFATIMCQHAHSCTVSCNDIKLVSSKWCESSALWWANMGMGKSTVNKRQSSGLGGGGRFVKSTKKICWRSLLNEVKQKKLRPFG